MSHDLQPDEMKCWSCRTNSATESFNYGGHETRTCRRCLQWLRARDELDALLRDVIASESEESTNDLLARLDTFLHSHQHLDDTGEFARKIAHHRVMALVDAGRYVEAEIACGVWKNLGFANAMERWEHGYETARTLVALQQPEGALHVLEDALQYHDAYFLGIAEKLELLVELVQMLGKTMKAEYVELARKVADTYGVQLDAERASAEMISKLAKSINDKLPPAALDREREVDRKT